MRRRAVLRSLAGGLVAALLLGAWMPRAATPEASPCVFCRGVGPEAILNVAHAGASSIAPQNTLAAGRAALQAGANVWGVDVRRTRDGIVVLMHDETLERTTNAPVAFPERSPWRVADFAFDEIRELDAGSWFVEEDPFGQIDARNVSPEALGAFHGEQVPSLREALEVVVANEWLIDVEVKAPFDIDRSLVAEELLNLIEQTGATGRVLVSSFDHEFLREFRARSTEIPIGALSLLPPPEALTTLLDLGADVYLPSPVGFLPPLLEELDAAGIHVIVWTHNTSRQLEYAAGLPGVDGIYTDFPQRLTEILRADDP